MELRIRRFDELSVNELYEILKLRCEVFVVEQSCAYGDIDGLDREALHVALWEDGALLACLRIMDRGVESGDVSIGRVVAARRRQGLGTAILRAGMAAAVERFGAGAIYLEAQTYARGLYEKLGFRPISGEFLLDGIPHLKMRWIKEE